MMVESRYVTMGIGPHYVMMSGMKEMHKWFVDSWGMIKVNSMGICC